MPSRLRATSSRIAKARPIDCTPPRARSSTSSSMSRGSFLTMRATSAARRGSISRFGFARVGKLSLRRRSDPMDAFKVHARPFLSDLLSDWQITAHIIGRRIDSNRLSPTLRRVRRDAVTTVSGLNAHAPLCKRCRRDRWRQCRLLRRSGRRRARRLRVGARARAGRGIRRQQPLHRRRLSLRLRWRRGPEAH